MPAEQSLRARMRKLVAEIREIDDALVQPTSRLREDLGMDSLGSLELLSSISEQMNVHVDIEDAMGLVTAAALVATAPVLTLRTTALFTVALAGSTCPEEPEPPVIVATMVSAAVATAVMTHISWSRRPPPE